MGILDQFYGDSIISSNIFAIVGSASLLCVLGSRMFFNLKEASERGVNEGTDYGSHVLTRIRFDEPSDTLFEDTSSSPRFNDEAVPHEVESGVEQAFSEHDMTTET